MSGSPPRREQVPSRHVTACAGSASSSTYLQPAYSITLGALGTTTSSVPVSRYPGHHGSVLVEQPYDEAIDGRSVLVEVRHHDGRVGVEDRRDRRGDGQVARRAGRDPRDLGNGADTP